LSLLQSISVAALFLGDRGLKVGESALVLIVMGEPSMLLSHRPEDFRSDSFVFTSQEGYRIIGENYRNRVWVPLLTKLGIDNRKPYTLQEVRLSLIV
jgi:integrase